MHAQELDPAMDRRQFRQMFAAWPAHGLVALCRSGFESALAAELLEKGSESVPTGLYPVARPDSGHVLLRSADGQAHAGLADLLGKPLVFARRVYLECATHSELPPRDRLTPLLSLLPETLQFNGLELAHPDTNTGKGVGRFLRGFRKALEPALAQQGPHIDAATGPRLSLFFPDSGQVHAGWCLATDVEWPMGIPRLRLPRDAPSRSLLKLEEGLLSLLTERERAACLQPGMRAVDLGAAPGGWSHYLLRRGLEVTGVDHGGMVATVAEDPGFRHVSADGFTWRPERPVDWVVCDIVDKPARVAEHMALWLASGWSRHALFNLKLPMKRRHETVRDLLARFESRMGATGPRRSLRCRQLYHDREEVTVAVIDREQMGGDFSE